MDRSITARKATLGDLETVIKLYLASANPSWTRLNIDTLKAGVETLLSCPEKGFQVIAEVNNQVIGIMRTSPEWSPYRRSTFWWCENVYVVPEWRRKGVYTKMYQLIFEAAKKDDAVCGIRLYTDQDNNAARKAYLKLGMRGMLSEQFEIDFVFGPEKKSQK